MSAWTRINGLYIPKEDTKTQQPVYLRKFDCPHCGKFYDRDIQDAEEATIGNAGPGPRIPHINCPQCKKCMGCGNDRQQL